MGRNFVPKFKIGDQIVFIGYPYYKNDLPLNIGEIYKVTRDSYLDYLDDNEFVMVKFKYDGEDLETNFTADYFVSLSNYRNYVIDNVLR